MKEEIEYQPVNEKRGNWTITGTREIYSNPYGMRFLEDRVIRPDGKPGIRTRIIAKKGVYAVPVDKNKNVHLIDEFYYNWNARTLACICGGIDEGEDSRQAVEKELKQEGGITASDLVLLTDPDPQKKLQPCGLLNSPTDVYLARGLKFGNQELESVEDIKTVKMPFESAIRKIGTEIIDGLSCSSLSMAYFYLANEKLK